MFGALFSAVGSEFHLELLLNTDVTTLFLKDWAEAGLVTEEARKKFKKDRRGATTTSDKQHQDRTISLMTTISAAGELVSTIAIIKDSNIEKLENITVSSK